MNIRNLFSFVVLFFSLFSWSSATFGLVVPADWKFKKISTPHFDIIYNAEQQELGELYAQQMEKAYSLLRPVFSDHPEKTLIIVNDNTDATNGYATRIPYPHIMAYPVLPGPTDSLSESGDWTLELLAHEYTHVLNFEPAHGVFSYLRPVFGTIMAPNILLPSWWKEGLAVQTESSITPNGGRLKSLYQDAVIRGMVEDKKLKDYDVAKANEYIPSWPEGMRPYLFGSIFWSQVVADKKVEVINKMNIRHSERVPYFIEEVSRENLGEKYADFYDRALAETEKRAEAQLKKIREIPTTPSMALPFQAKYSSAPAISDNGQYMAAILVDFKNDRALDIFYRDPETKMISKKLQIEIPKENEPLIDKKDKDGPATGSIQKIAWFHKSPKIVYDKIRYINRIERYSDLYVYDIDKKKSKNLTKGLRGREPSVSPNDDKIVFVKLEGGRTRLAVFDIASEKQDILFSPAIQERLSSPIYLDDKNILFALRNSNGEEGLYHYSMETRSIVQVLTDYKQARFPALTKRGVIFTSSKNGVHNLYLASSDLKTAKPLTNVTTMVSSSAMDPETENIYSTFMTGSGPQVRLIHQSEWLKTPETLPMVDGLFADRYKTLYTAEATPEPSRWEVGDYSPWPYMYPRYWIPFIWTTPEGGILIQAQTSAYDPLQKHMYSLMAGYDTYQQVGDWGVGYLNNVTSVPVEFSASQSHSYLVERENRIKDTLVTLGVLPDVWSLSEDLGVQIGWRYLEREALTTDATKRTGPTLGVAYRTYTQGGEQISPQKGYGVVANGVHYIEGKNLMSHDQYMGSAVGYLGHNFLPKWHAVMLRAAALYTPQKIASIYGTQSESLNYSGEDLAPKFLARAYSSGQFIGRNMYNASFEYRFPLHSIYRGPGTTPLFFRRLSGAVVVDALSSDGSAYNPKTEAYDRITAKDIFWSYGGEVHFETTVGYVLPITFVAGVYVGSNATYSPMGNVALGIQLGGL